MKRPTITIAAAAMAVLAAVAWCGAPATAFAGEQLAAADKAKKKKKKRHPGKKLYMTKTCIACHGRNGAKAIQGFPNLAGQTKTYMVKQVEDILSGKRLASKDETGHSRTQGMVGALINPEGKRTITKEEVKQISDWLAMQTPAKPLPPKTPVDPARIEQGKKLYKKYKCHACHGKNALKPLKGYPIIAGQKKEYILGQMADIKNKVRTNGKSKLMAAYPTIKKGKDADFEIIADYLSQIDRTK